MILVGCCGFPEARARYVREFPVVEVQQTFYQLPRPELAARWREAAPPGFRWSMKAWQLVTHPPSSPTYRRLREPLGGPPEAYGWFRPTPQVLGAWERTLGFARALGARWVVFQCPASFRPEPENLRHLRRFFRRAPRDGMGFAWEPRGPWPQDLVAELCRELGLAHAVDPFAAPQAPSPLAYFRLHGRGGYRHTYTDEELRTLLRLCREALDGGREEVVVLFNNLTMLSDARRFRELARRELRELVA